MTSQNLSTVTPRDSEAKQIDHNDAIRATYFSNEQIRDCGAVFASNGGSSKLPGFAPFDFFARHKENEKEILRVDRKSVV